MRPHDPRTEPRPETGRAPRALQWRTVLTLSLLLPVAAAALGLALYARVQWALDAPYDSGGLAREVEVRRGEGLRDVQAQLEAAGILRPRTPLALWGRLTGLDRQIKAGLYVFSPAQSARGILRALVDGRTRRLHVTIPEGWGLARILPRLKEALRIGEEELAAAVSDSIWVQSLGIPGPGLEGYLFPETYAFEYGTPAREVLAYMARTCVARLDETRRSRAESLSMSLREVITLASIIQSEAAIEGEMPRISAVYHNRLRQHRRLEADPTVAYALGRMGQRLWERDLRVESPYNTYRNIGLPPGPICCPGLASIDAALHPLDGCQDMYFVARGDGSHVFSRNLAAHNRARDAIRRARARLAGS
jgi:UPF0755 protein